MDILLWHEILEPYELAVKELQVKFRHLIKEHHGKGLYSPIESVSGRVKSVSSILEKMQRKGIVPEEMEEQVEDIAGIRIIKTNHLPSGVVTAESGEKNDYTGDFSNTVALALQKEAIGTVKLKDLTVEKSGSDFHVVYQATMMLAKYAIN